ncbi:MAG: Cell division protein FtsA [Candidatus Woesebacteria bacterium]|jgi:cell division protein FtsA|nr:MAG: Cell division protein FtsA [Candidatus Woesebacteria bacterium]
MTRSKIISAIDLGSSKITTIIAQIDSSQDVYESGIGVVGVSSVASRGIRKGQIINIEEAVESIVESVESAERMAGYNLDSVYISLGGASVSSQNSHGVVAISDPDGEIKDVDIERVIDAASAISLPVSREILHIIPREFTVDGEGGVKDPVGMTGVRLEVETHVITASTASVKNLKKAVDEAGVGISEIVFSGLAASEAVATATEKELGCVVVDIGGGTTSICVFVEGALAYSGVVPIGAKNVTNDLAIGLRISLESAEKIKLLLSNYEKRKDKTEEITLPDSLDLSKENLEVKKVSRKTLVEGIIRPRLNEIFSMVRLELDKFGLLGKTPSGVIITGGGAETVGIIESARRVLSLPARIGVPTGVSGLIDDILSPQYAVAIGLILYASHQTSDEALTKMGKKIKLPGKGTFNKIFESIRNLLP